MEDTEEPPPLGPPVRTLTEIDRALSFGAYFFALPAFDDDGNYDVLWLPMSGGIAARRMVHG
jgi:hypothetical protein